MRRRTFSLGIGVAGASVVMAGTSTPAIALPGGVGQDLAIQFPAGEPVPTLAELLQAELRLTGNEPAYRAEVDRAASILVDSPTSTTPLAVATYFARLNAGEFGSVEAEYAREWPERANPVIVSFFDATTFRRPNGDITPWCAAFVNWCIVRAREGTVSDGLLAPTRSAASKDFRDWGRAADNPVPGDLAVFERTDDPERGHVAFYLAESANFIYVLGGNQRSSARVNNGEVNSSMYARRGSNLILHSIRTDPSLHAA